MHVNPSLCARIPNVTFYDPLPAARALGPEADTAQHGDFQRGALDRDTDRADGDVMREHERQSSLRRWQTQGRER